MEMRNLTPHNITFVNEKNEVIRTVEPYGPIARVSTNTITTGEIDGIPVTKTEFGVVENLPNAESGVIYIVSSIVADRVAGRNDVFVPNEFVRDEKGVIIGCKSLRSI